MLHGLGCDALAWPADIRRIPGARVLAIDLPGHGKSGGPGRQSIDAYAQAVVLFLKELGIEKAFLVGHCLGGAVALSVAAHLPERVAGLALVATGSRLPIPSGILENAANPSTFPLAIKMLLERSFGPHTPAALRETFSRRVGAIRQTLLHGDLLACDRFDSEDWLHKIHPQTLVLCGTADGITPLRYAENLARQISGAALQTIDGGGHLLPAEHPTRLARLLGMFLATL